jgi:hypothetical protein
MMQKDHNACVVITHRSGMVRTLMRLTAGLALIFVVACSGGDGTRASLAFGLRVPRGAHLVMPLMPCSVVPTDQGCENITSAAVLQIDTKPHVVLNDLLAQGRRLGLRGGVTCQRTPNRVRCDGDMYRLDATSQSPAAPETLIQLDYGVRDEKLGPTKTLTLRFAAAHLYGGVCAQPCSSRVADFHIADPGNPKSAPRVGDILQPRFGLDELRLLPNTHPVAHVVASSGRGDSLWLIAVDGDTRKAATRYETMISKHRFSPVYSGRRSRTEAGWHINEWWISGDSDPSVLVDVVQRSKTEYIALRITPYA